MTNDTIKIFVGCDPNNCDLEQMMVLEYSIRKHTVQEVDIHWMQLSQDTESPWYSNQEQKAGWRTEKWATPFSGFRWAIPELCHFTGKAIYMDADVIVLSDLAELWNTPIQSQSMVIAKGGKSTARLCTCLWDCEKAKNYLPSLEQLRTDPDSHKNLMKLIKEKPYLVQAYTDSYNCIDGEGLAIEDIKILHYSDMGTQFSHKYALPRLESEGQIHWFDGKILEHPRPDLAQLFDQYYQEALAAGYILDHYRIAPYGNFSKATQQNYTGNPVTRTTENQSWFKRHFNKMRSKLSKKHFTLDG